MTFPNESTIKVNGKWITLVAIPLETLALEKLAELYETDLSDEGMMKSYHKALEAQAARQAELN